jgi:hypothetical protein
MIKLEIILNTLNYKEWWFDLGISFSNTKYGTVGYKYVLTIGLAFLSIHIRMGRKNK